MNCLVVQLKNEVMCRTLEFLTDDPSIKESRRPYNKS
nr:MAG TPA: hypothetical protein [Crassvirales sp.]